MKIDMNRRDFLKGTAWMGATAMLAGCQMSRFGLGQGGIMQNYALKPMKSVRVAFIVVRRPFTASR